MKPLENSPTKAPAKGRAISATVADYWSLTAEQVTAALHTSNTGLPQNEAANRLKQYGPNALKAQRQTSAFGLLLRQFKSPLVLILIFAAIVSAFLGEWTDAIIVLSVVLGSTMLGLYRNIGPATPSRNCVRRLPSNQTCYATVNRSCCPPNRWYLVMWFCSPPAA